MTNPGKKTNQASAHLDLLGVQVFGSPEHEALGHPFAAELVDLNHASERDEAHQRVGREQAEGHLQGLPEGLEVLFFQARVHHIQEDERGGGAALQTARQVMVKSKFFLGR